MKLSSSVELCVGKSLVDDLGLATAANRGQAGRPLQDAQGAVGRPLIKSFDDREVVAASAFAATFARAGCRPDGSGTELEACLTKEFDGKVGTVAAAISEPASDSATTKSASYNCPTHDLVRLAALESGDRDRAASGFAASTPPGASSCATWVT